MVLDQSVTAKSSVATKRSAVDGIATGKASGRAPSVNRSVARALSLLLDVAHSQKPQSFIDLQRRHKLPKATLHKLLSTLEATDFLRRDEETGKYAVGLAAMEVSR